MKPHALLLLMLLLAGCAASQQVPGSDRTRSFEVAPERLVEAAAAFFRAENFEVDVIPPGTTSRNGIVQTKLREENASRMRAVATVIPDEDQSSQLQLDFFIEEATPDGRWKPIGREAIRRRYLTYLDGISSQLNP